MLVSAYLWVWLLTTLAVFAAATAASVAPPPGPLTRGLLSALAGALWPVLAVASAQIAFIWLLQRKMRAAPPSHSPRPSTDYDEALVA